MTARHFISSEIYRKTGYRGNHPLAIQRIGSVLTLCEQLGWLTPSGPRAYVPSLRADFDQLCTYHDPDYVIAVRDAETRVNVSPEDRERYGLGTMENPIFPGLFERASTAVGGSILAAQLASEGGVAYHPSGGTHHAMRKRAGGFCYFNDPVFAILTFLKRDKRRVLYVDIDAHHGDGVEAAFSGDPRVMLMSIHEENRWPYTGALDDRARGNARNMPVPRGMNDSEFAYLLDNAVMPLAGDFSPDAVVITCGADALAGDPLSGLALSNLALWDAVGRLTEVSPSTVVLGGGGYNPWTVARCWTGLWGRLIGADIPAHLPPESTALLESLDCDLVDEEDREPEWTTTLADAPKTGPVRPRFREIAEAVRAPQRTAEMHAPEMAEGSL